MNINTLFSLMIHTFTRIDTEFKYPTTSTPNCLFRPLHFFAKYAVLFDKLSSKRLELIFTNNCTDVLYA